MYACKLYTRDGNSLVVELTISLLLLFYVIVLLLQRNSTKTIKKEHSHYKVKKICNVNKKGF